jgi:adenylate cyclase
MEHPRQGELRLVTAVFADVSGFTDLATRLDPEELSEAIDPVIEALGNVVARYGGFVEKYAGDALLAVFGAPVSHEDDPTRALLAALEMRRELTRLHPGLALHVGVNSGRGVARAFGSEARADYGVIGEPIIVAQRLESVTPPGDIYVSEGTRRLVAEQFEFDSIGALQLKGFDEPVETWRLASEKAFHAAATEPLVGRAAELAELTAALARLRAGRGVAVTVIGEPGVGKSRLSQEFRAQAEELAWLQLRCFSYEADHAYAPYAELLRRIEHPNSAYFESLLGEPTVDVDPEAFRRELHRAFRSWLSDVLAEQPVVLAVEDIHWIDASSLELTAQLAQLRAGLPLLVYVTTRENGQRLLSELGEPRLELRLAPFAPDEVESIVSDLLEGARPPPELTSLVVERSAGNPFFAGELVRSLREAGALWRDGDWQVDLRGADATVPATVEGTLSARIDLLAPATAALLQTAAVIGRRVPIRLLAALAEQVQAGIDELVRLRFLDRLNAETVVFHHALVQEVVYGRILRRRRRDLHAQVADAVEALYGGEGDAVDLLARHLYHAEAGYKAVVHLRLAGERAQRMYANEEAVTRFQMALERLANVRPDEVPGDLEAALRRELGEVLDLTGRYADARAAYRASVEAEPDVLQRACTMASLGTVVKRAGRYAEAERVLAGAEEELGPPGADDNSQWWRAWLDVADARFALYYWLDDIARMEPLIERMRPRIDAVGTPRQRMRFFSSLVLLGLRRDRLVPSDATVDAAEEELAAGLEVGDGTRHFDVGFCRLWRNELDQAQAHFESALEEAERTGDAILRTRCLLYLSMAYRKRGNVSRVSEILDSDQLAEGLGYRGLAEANRAWVALREEHLELAEEHAQNALAHWARDERTGPTAFQWSARWPLLAVAIARGDWAAARAQTQAMLAPAVQPLPDRLARALADEDFERALALARESGYA